MSRFLAALILASAALPALAQTYKWVDEKGQVNYSNALPPSAADKAQPVEERISIMGMDPAVRAWAERRFAAEERAEQLDWQHRQQALAAQARAAPPPSASGSELSPYTFPYLPPATYATVLVPTHFATKHRVAPQRPVAHHPVRHTHRNPPHRHRRDR